jgi:hypothetical protein
MKSDIFWGWRRRNLGVSATNNASWNGRRAVVLENERVRLVFLPGGGHVAAFEMKLGPAAGINPLWVPPWTTMDPGEFEPSRHLAEYGGPPEGRLLASLAGHNLCMPWFGPPTKEEESRGLGVHGEAPVADWKTSVSRERRRVRLDARAVFTDSALAVTRSISLEEDSTVVRFETVVQETRRGGGVRPLGWQEHVTLGSPFIERGRTILDMSAGWSRVMPGNFARNHRLQAGGEFEWPYAPARDGGAVNLRTYPAGTACGDFTTHLNQGDSAWFTALNPESRLAIGYVWNPGDFPWLGMWTENRDRDFPPWNNRTIACGMEFGLSPWPRPELPGKLHGMATLGSIPSGGAITAVFHAFLAPIPFFCEGVRGVRIADKEAALDLVLPRTA